MENKQNFGNISNLNSNFFLFFDKSINISAKTLIIFSLGFYLLSSLYFLLTSHYFLNVFGFLFFILFVLSAYFVSYKINSDKTSIIIIFSFSLIVLGIWNYMYNIQPVSDYEVLLDGAKSILNGSFPDLAKEKDNYFYFYNFQIGYTFYLSILLKLFGGSLLSLKIIEILTITFTNIILYKIMRIHFDVKESLFTSILMVINPYIFIGSGIINNQHISTLLFLLALYIYLSKKSFIKYLFCGILLSVAQVLRPTITLVFVAFIICGLLYGFLKKEKQIIFGTILLFFIYYLSFNLINTVFIYTDIAPIGIKNSNIYFKLILGLTNKGITGQDTTDASHTQLYYDLKFFNFDYNAYKEAAKEHLKSCLGKKETYIYLCYKMVNFTGNIDNQSSYINCVLDKLNYYVLNTFIKTGAFLYFFSILFSFIHSIKENKLINNKFSILSILIFGLFFFSYIVLEVQTRYRYEQYYMLFLLSMPLFYRTIEKIHTKFFKKHS